MIGEAFEGFLGFLNPLGYKYLCLLTNKIIYIYINTQRGCVDVSDFFFVIKLVPQLSESS